VEVAGRGLAVEAGAVAVAVAIFLLDARHLVGIDAEEDERETKGRRALLNLGHTFGHALEAETAFAMLHGEAVALGMRLAFRFSAERGLCPPADAERVEAHLAACGLPTRLAVGTPKRLIEHMTSDKKASGGRVPFILARGIGKAFIDTSVELRDVEAFLAREMGR
jgi:3-dehydroquinate synthase